LPEGLEFVPAAEPKVNLPALAPPVAAEASALEAMGAAEDVDPNFAIDEPAEATMGDLMGAMMDLVPMAPGQGVSLESVDFADRADAKDNGCSSTTYTYLLEAAREDRKERHATLIGDLRGLLDMVK
jgi:hypothetical protein